MSRPAPLPSRVRRLSVLLVLVLGSCAFTNRANRPVWNAFEATMVPESNGAFWATLPFTVVVGLGAILVDTFIAHPIQVVDDAWSDTTDLWKDLPFEEHYYTQSAWLPLRAIGTPVVFVGSFLGRSMFDWPAPAEVEARRIAAAERRREAALLWLERIENGDDVRESRSLRGAMDAELAAAVTKALATGSAHGRLLVYRAVSSCDDPTIVDWVAALGDPSAVVRYYVIRELPDAMEMPRDVVRRLIEDPDEAVAERARRRWPQ